VHDASVLRERVRTSRVARLASVDPDGRVHLVPIVFALDDDTLYSAVDTKPKRSRRLRRIENVRARPAVTILVDCYDEDWSRLWWVRVDGEAAEVSSPRERERALGALAAAYPQYAARPPQGPVIGVRPRRWRGWRA
jgi:PPOX class probable F420-dependent enzyme